MPRRYLHWDEDAIVLHGGSPAMRGEPPRGCVRGLRSIVLDWDELERVRLVEPFPSIELAYRFERGRQTEVVRPSRGREADAFDAHVRTFLDVVRSRLGPRGILPGWEELPSAPFEPTAALPNDPRFPSAGGYRHAPRPEPLVAYRWQESVAERWRVTLWKGEGVGRSFEGSFEQLLVSQGFPWAVRGSEVALTHEHAYVSGPRGGARVPLDALRHRVDLPNLRLYIFGRRTVLAFAERFDCEVQDALDELLRPRVRSAVV